MSFSILVVDDNPVVRRMVIKSLKFSGLDLKDIYEANNGIEGWEVLIKKNIDFILADMDMPEMNGEELLEKVRSNPETEKIPMVFITGYDPESKFGGKIKGKVRIIRKPFSPEKLGEMVINLISEDSN